MLVLYRLVLCDFHPSFNREENMFFFATGLSELHQLTLAQLYRMSKKHFGMKTVRAVRRHGAWDV